MHTGMICTTHTPYGRPYHGLSNRAPTTKLNNSITFNNKITATPRHIGKCFTKHTLSDTQYTQQTDQLTEKHKTYKDITVPQLRSRRQ